MDNIMKKLEKTLVPFGSKLATNNVLSSIRDGIAAVMPIIMVGSLALIIKNFPTATDPTKDKWAQFLAGDGQGFADFLVKIWYASFGIMALVSVFGIAYNYAQRKGVDGFSSAVIALASYIVTLPLAVTQLDKKTFSTGIDFGQLGSNGLFGAILVGVISSVIFTFFVKHKITIKMPDTVPPAVANSFMALIPGFVILVFWNLVATLLAKTDLHSINNMMETLLGKPLESFGGSLIGVIVVATLTSLFWFVGVHGGNITGAIMGPIYLNMMANNLKNYQAHKFLENIVTTPFMDMFVYLGGGGATLGLVIVLTLFAKSKQNKTMKPLVMVP
ncbi:MAG: PTS transporter subunit EIIC, partial [Lactobacillaceae bacterium]|nr:PTS transporter subunit EIIC [Lactobacillaceae bacterium]